MNGEQNISRQPSAVSGQPRAASCGPRATSHEPRATTHGAKPWYREPWPWILMAGPAAAIVGGGITVWLAVSTADGLVADDYYRRGLAINQEIRRDQAVRDRGIAASVERQEGVLRVRLTGGGTAPEALFAQLVHTTRAGHDLRLRLVPVAPGVYEARLPELAAGRWRLVIEDPRREWRIVKEGL